MNWLYSTNTNTNTNTNTYTNTNTNTKTKKMGTLYLMFSIFAGMLNASSSVYSSTSRAYNMRTSAGSWPLLSLFGFNLDQTNWSVSDIFSYIFNIFPPVTVGYSNDLLSKQHQGIAISLFIMCVGVLVLFMTFFFNCFILIFRDRIIKYFTNRYILAYLKINIRIMIIEMLMFGFLITFYIFKITEGLIFLMTHPIIVP